MGVKGDESNMQAGRPARKVEVAIHSKLSMAVNCSITQGPTGRFDDPMWVGRLLFADADGCRWVFGYTPSGEDESPLRRRNLDEGGTSPHWLVTAVRHSTQMSL